MNKYLDIVFNLPLDQSFSYLCDEKGEACIGKRVMASFGKREVLGFCTGAGSEAPSFPALEKLKAVRRVVDKEPVFDNEDIELAEWMASFYLCGTGEALAAMIPSGKRTGSFSVFSDDDIGETGLLLSGEQNEALAGITGMANEVFAKKPKSPVIAYLYGITGSGKTEVFLRLAENMIKTGKTVIYLVPEISLTHQTAELIARRFGTAATSLHSGMSGSERFTEWMRIRKGEASIVVGPRSAIFAPLRNLGLIIIDEEHDGSYKSGNTPRYHARQIAMHRAARENALLLLGSATPSAESWKLMEEGVIKRFSLHKRLSGGKIPEIIPVNLEKTSGSLTEELKEEIRRCALLKRQTILFLNRRGFAYFYHCRECGFDLTCRRCSVSLTYHKNKNRASCHYCGYEIKPPVSCPKCGSLDAGFKGFGTEFIEEEVRRTFPELRIMRADADTTGRKGSLREILTSFRNGDIDLLLGTQMVAKGLNFPGVRLVGVVFADTGLHLPDLRAAERTFSLIVQVAGRAGRYFPDGKVIVQTLRMEDPAIKKACTLDIDGFYHNELKQRSVLGFPPYSRLIRFVIRSKKEEKAINAAGRIAGMAVQLLSQNGEILGPSECPIGIINGSYRRQILFRGPSLKDLHKTAKAVLKQYEKEAGVYIEVDVDPVQLL